MSRQERFGTRDLAFSAWHREIPRDDFTWIDIDHCAYCNTCKQVIYLFELAMDVGQDFKATTITCNLANRLGVPALLVLYQLGDDKQIVGFRIKRIAPSRTEFAVVEPRALVDWIAKTRDEHVCAVAPLKEAA